jgi:hypothetical protein
MLALRIGMSPVKEHGQEGVRVVNFQPLPCRNYIASICRSRTGSPPDAYSGEDQGQRNPMLLLKLAQG